MGSFSGDGLQKNYCLPEVYIPGKLFALCEFGNQRSRAGRHQKKLAFQPHLRYLLTQDT